jgi:hypothetical protein
MNDDFLGSLAAQTLGTASVIRPRVTSRFESRPAGADLRHRWSEPAAIEVNVHASPELAEIENRVLTSPVPTAPVDRWPDLATISPIAKRVLPWDIETEKGAPIGTPAPILPRPAASSEPSEYASRTGGSGLLAQSDLRQEPPSVSSIRSVKALGQSNPATQEATQPLSTDDLAQPPTFRPATIAPEVRPARQRGVPVQARHANRDVPAAREPAETEPIIQVTIGRVEVRATMSQPALPMSRPASPIMTLEEYVRRKTERGNS